MLDYGDNGNILMWTQSKIYILSEQVRRNIKNKKKLFFGALKRTAKKIKCILRYVDMDSWSWFASQDFAKSRIIFIGTSRLNYLFIVYTYCRIGVISLSDAQTDKFV